MNKIVCILLLLSAFYSLANSFTDDLVNAANDRTTQNVRYDGAYHRITYPNGDVPDNIGVCTDVIIRSYRALGIDLQKLVHEDMRDNFSAYPSTRIWGLTKPDSNIDHRRVPNLQIFFKRHGTMLPITNNADTYKAGDIVTWMLPGNLPHIITNASSPRNQDFRLFHELVDVLQNPFDDQPDHLHLAEPPKPEQEVLKTFCGT